MINSPGALTNAVSSLDQFHHLYTDGSVHLPSHLGGWAFLVQVENGQWDGSGAEREIDSNRMELVAVQRGLKTISEGVFVRIHSDSTYVRGVLEALFWHERELNGILRHNEDVWRLLDALLQKRAVEFSQVQPKRKRIPEHDYCHHLAREALWSGGRQPKSRGAA